MIRTRILVPCDFSPTALNAAHYAAQLAYDSNADAQLVLLYVSDAANIGSDGSPISGDDEGPTEAIKAAIQELQVKLYAQHHVPTDYRVMKGDLIFRMRQLLEEEKFDCVFMGITGGGAFTEMFLGSTVLDIIEKTDTPVVIVPPDAVYRPLKKLALALELKQVADTVPVEKIYAWLKVFKSTLEIVYVHHHMYNELSDLEKAEQEVLKDLFDDYNPSFSRMNIFDFTTAINKYAEENSADMVMVVPRHHSLLERIFGPESHLKKLAFHSHKPIVAVHDL